jgi:hypothetical protein
MPVQRGNNMALPTFQELLQAYSSVGGGADAIRSLTGGLEKGKEMVALIEKRKQEKAMNTANISKTEAEAKYYGSRDPQEEARIRAEATKAAAEERTQAAKDIAGERNKSMQELASIIEGGRNSRATSAAATAAENTKVNAASSLARTKPTKEGFLAKIGQFVSHPIDTLTKPTPPTPQQNAQTFLQQKFQPNPAVTAQAPVAQSAPASAAPAAQPQIYTYPSGRKIQYNPTIGAWEPVQ